MFCMCTRACMHANDTKIMCSRVAKCNTEESPLALKGFKCSPIVSHSL